MNGHRYGTVTPNIREAARITVAARDMDRVGPKLIVCRTCGFKHQWPVACPKCCGRFGTASGELLGK